MIFANCEIYENDKGSIGVLVRTNEDNASNSFLINDNNPDDVSINFDRRLIEYALDYPRTKHTYREWDKLLSDCGYDISLFKKDYYLDEDPEDPIYEEKMEHYDDPVEGFEVICVPKNMYIRIGSESVYDYYGCYLGEKQIVQFYSKDEFIET